MLLESPLSGEFEFGVVDASPRTGSVESESRFRPARALTAVQVLWRFLFQLLVRRPDLVHVNTPYHWAMLRDGLIVWLGWVFRVPVVLHFHGGDFPSFSSGLPSPLDWLLRCTLRRTRLLVAITRQTELYLGQVANGDRVHYLPNFVAIESRLAKRTVERDSSSRVKFLFVGWMIPAKGLNEVLEAASRIPEAEFVFVGPFLPGSEEEIRDRATRIGSHVVVKGPLPHEDVQRLYLEADALVLPSYREGFPIVVLEAMAAGLPILATRVGAIPDVVRDGVDGFLIEPRDSVILEETLKHFTEDPAIGRRLGENARQRVRENFALEVVIAQLRDLYLQLAETGNDGPPADLPA